MGNAAALREALAAFLGEERYRKFVKQGVAKGRLRFWQEEAWTQFTTTHPELDRSLEELAVALRVCWLHGAELLPGTAMVVDGQTHFDEGFLRTKATTFPCSGPAQVWYDGCQSRRVNVWYCPECQRVEARWLSCNP
jgi:hypothetical protein